jgi:hypothetical protein
MKFTLENLKKYIATDKSLNEILSDLVKIGTHIHEASKLVVPPPYGNVSKAISTKLY